MSGPGSIVAALRDEILELRLAPGAPLREIALGERFGASRRSVREALHALHREGIVEHEPNRGAAVRVFSEEHIRDLYRVRRALECEGAMHCVSAGQEALNRVAETFERLACSAGDAQDSARHAVRDMEFHASIIGLVGSKKLDAFFATTSVEMSFAIRILQRDEVVTAIASEQLIAEHGIIAASIAARDSAAARRTILQHINENESRLTGLISASPTPFAAWGQRQGCAGGKDA